MQGLGQNLTQATLVEWEYSDQYLNPAHVSSSSQSTARVLSKLLDGMEKKK